MRAMLNRNFQLWSPSKRSATLFWISPSQHKQLHQRCDGNRCGKKSIGSIALLWLPRLLSAFDAGSAKSDKSLQLKEDRETLLLFSTYPKLPLEFGRLAFASRDTDRPRQGH